MDNLYVCAKMAQDICADENIPFPLSNGDSYLLKTGAKINKHRNRYVIGGYAADGSDVTYYENNY